VSLSGHHDNNNWGIPPANWFTDDGTYQVVR